ncbi:MAG: antitoxin VbhA family protein [Methylococcaceae bacterium]|nr:antitoxin VbhA family protein [Methylococcaceae bacterium]
MSQTTMKVDRDVLADLRELATAAHRSPQKHLRHLVEVEKAKQVRLEDIELTPEQQARLDTVSRTEASSALEGYAPQSEEGGYAYELQKQWVLGEINTEQHIKLLKKKYRTGVVEKVF